MNQVSEEKKLFVERFEQVIEERGLSLRANSAIANAMGIDDQTLKRYRDPERENKPDMINLKKMCTYLKVSADYLLGITDVMDPDVDIRELCKETGLTEKSVKTLASNRKELSGIIKVLNQCIERKEILTSLGHLIDTEVKSQVGDMMNKINKNGVTKQDITSKYIKLHSKENQIINYETQYKLSRDSITLFEKVVMDSVCDKVYRKIKQSEYR